MKYYIFIILICALLLSSCSLEKDAPQRSISAPPSLEAEAVEAPSREAIFTYGGAKDLPRKLVLILAGEPVLLPSGYVRLVGVVSGGRPIALIEIGGRGLALGKGENINDYRVVGINDNSVVLERGK